MKVEDAPGANLMTSSERGVTVLLVDDSKTIRRSACDVLNQAGYTVITAVDGFEALAKVVEHKPSLVLVDIMMPRLDGYQTCALIKNNAEFRKTPVIMLSNKDGLFDKARARVVGSDAHLSKPFTAENLVATVDGFTQQSSGETTIEGPAKARKIAARRGLQTEQE